MTAVYKYISSKEQLIVKNSVGTRTNEYELQWVSVCLQSEDCSQPLEDSENSFSRSREVCKLNCFPDRHFYLFPKVTAWSKHIIRSRTAGPRPDGPGSTLPGINPATQWMEDWTLTPLAITNLRSTPLPNHVLGAYRYKSSCIQLRFTGQPRLKLPSRKLTSWAGKESKDNILVSFLQQITSYFPAIFPLF